MRSSSQILNALLYLFFIDCLLVEVTHQNGVKKISTVAEGITDYVPPQSRVDCAPGQDRPDEIACEQLGCLYDGGASVIFTLNLSLTAFKNSLLQFFHF
ncbi:unnamed protein product [Anisakis simplex]|uniref:P-type domain-containing protein n=1 Tax=Anisakis simplex TaxID=6269 RepID=A0A0M3KDB1_ANISI|nr:unnamed protein product [Anisakis simplex]